MSIDLLEIKNHMPSYNPNSSLKDCIKWLPTPGGIYSVASTLASLKTHHPLVPWFELVWYSHNIPRMSFILWLAIRGRLLTLDRVHLYNPHVGRSFWEVKAPQTYSWNWRKLLKLRPIARPLIRHIIGNGFGTSLWFDNWHPDGPIHLKWSSRVIYDSGHPIKTKVSSIVHGDQWVWPCSMSIDLLEIKNHISSYNPNSSLEDCINWLPTPDGIYYVALTMASLKTPHPLVPWFELVWYSHNIPRMSFILWLAIRERLSTLDRVHLYNPRVGTLCVLCSSSPKTHAHLFFECAYSKVIWSHLKDMCGRPWNGHSWPRFIAWAAQRWKGKSHSIVVKKLCLTVVTKDGASDLLTYLSGPTKEVKGQVDITKDVEGQTGLVEVEDTHVDPAQIEVEVQTDMAVVEDIPTDPTQTETTSQMVVQVAGYPPANLEVDVLDKGVVLTGEADQGVGAEVWEINQEEEMA
ncbi:hypothetical protein Dsin_017338 [Dipteronia sinensis]|uniref:Reverse transcriptase zinc-binding domain-containing protein n=1 Tax=Dipteronia sinensis TaxID=43782 RepID=A0AAE0E6L1_9ROSI|nr:hypothetical protein Dsin_017338 [Dipteronia sinensis]